MKNSTLVYLENDKHEYLMMHRVKKENDVNHDKWVSPGGKFEDGESPEECAIREVREETGLIMENYRYCGIITFVSDLWETEYMHLFHTTSWKGSLLEDCDEGTLEWISHDQMNEIPQWSGDRIFFSLMEQKMPFFSLKLRYRGETLVEAVYNGTPLLT